MFCIDIPDLLAKLSTTVDTLMRNVESLQADSNMTQKENRNVSSMYVKMFPAGERVWLSTVHA